jgi:hypothetical protein
MKELQKQYELIKEGKGNKTDLLRTARRLFPDLITPVLSYNDTVKILKQKSILFENVGGVITTGTKQDWHKIFKENITEYGEDSGGQDMTYGIYDRSSARKNQGNQDFINKGKEDFYDDVPYEACPYEDGYNKYYKADLAKLWQMGWKDAEAEDQLPPKADKDIPSMGLTEKEDEDGTDEMIQRHEDEQDAKHTLPNIGNLREEPSNKEKRKLSLKQIDKKDKKGLALYKNTEDSNDLYYYDGKVLYSVVDGDKKGPSLRMSLYDITGLNQNESLTEVKIGDIIKHKLTGAEFKITKISGNNIEGKYTKLGGMEGKVKVGDTNKTNKNLIGKTYELISEAKEAKAIEKETTKEVTDMATRGYDYKDAKNYDNVFGEEFLKGFYTEMGDSKNEGKTVEELKAIVAKNLAKDISHYVKDGQFGLKGVGYTTEAPGLGEPKEAKGKHKSSGYGDLKESVLRTQIYQLIKEVLAEEKK